MTEATDTSPQARPTRAPRRAPDDLPFSFVDAALLARIDGAGEEPAWLREDRLAALAQFETLPVEASRLYTPYVDLRAASLDGASPYVSTSAAVAAPLDGAQGTDDTTSGVLELAEDLVATASLEPAAAAAGVRLMTLGELVRREPELARRLLTDDPILPVDDKLAWLGRAAWTQGVVLHVPAGVRVERPVVLRWAVGAPRTLIGRTLIVLEEGAEASVVEELVKSDGVEPGAQALLSLTTEIRLGAHARLALGSLQETGPDQIVFQQRVARVGEAADLRWALAQLGARLVRSRVDNVLAGDRGVVEQVEIVFGADDQLHDLTSYTRHVGRDTTGQLLSKGVLLDQARAYMKGLITIDKTAVGTDSFLGEFGMNLSKAARSVAIPSLEIDQPDCRRAAHSSSVGPIDEAQLFYLESRGIPPDEARKFIVLGFLEPVVARVPLEEARDRLREALEAKWAAGTGSAGSPTAAAAA
ncbi:MAG TPA: SufD family Fe-S cluster assembly protein [Candidatus Limnocylindrales bacterium]